MLNLTSKDMDSMAQNDLRDEADFASTFTRQSSRLQPFSTQAKEVAEIELALAKISDDIYGV